MGMCSVNGEQSAVVRSIQQVEGTVGRRTAENKGYPRVGVSCWPGQMGNADYADETRIDADFFDVDGWA